METFDSSDADDAQSPEELEAIMAPGSPARVAGEWFRHVLDGRVGDAWRLMDEDLRLCRAQGYLLHIGAARDDKRAAALAAVDSDDPVSPHMFDALAQLWSEMCASAQGQQVGTWSRPEAVTPDIEIVRITIGARPDRALAAEPIETVTVIMRTRADGWRVAGTGHQLARPGWPPTYYELSIED